MKTSLFFLSAIAGANAFAPASQVSKSTQLGAAELDSLRGVGPETGGKVVSNMTTRMKTIVANAQNLTICPFFLV